MPTVSEAWIEANAYHFAQTVKEVKDEIAGAEPADGSSGAPVRNAHDQIHALKEAEDALLDAHHTAEGGTNDDSWIHDYEHAYDQIHSVMSSGTPDVARSWKRVFETNVRNFEVKSTPRCREPDGSEHIPGILVFLSFFTVAAQSLPMTDTIDDGTRLRDDETGNEYVVVYRERHDEDDEHDDVVCIQLDNGGLWLRDLSDAQTDTIIGQDGVDYRDACDPFDHDYSHLTHSEALLDPHPPTICNDCGLSAETLQIVLGHDIHQCIGWKCTECETHISPDNPEKIAGKLSVVFFCEDCYNDPEAMDEYPDPVDVDDATEVWDLPSRVDT